MSATSPSLQTRPQLRQRRKQALVLQPVRRQAARLPPLQATTTPLHRPAPPRDPSGGALDGNDQDAGNQECLGPHEDIGGRDSADVETPESLEAPPACPPWRLARWQMPQGEENPTNWAPDYEPNNTVPRGRLPLLSELPDSLDPSPMNIKN